MGVNPTTLVCPFEACVWWLERDRAGSALSENAEVRLYSESSHKTVRLGFQSHR